MNRQHSNIVDHIKDPAHRAQAATEIDGLPSDAYGAGYHMQTMRQAIQDALRFADLETVQSEIADELLAWRKTR